MRSESLRTLGGTLNGEREARGGMHDGGELTGGSPTPGPAADIASVSVRGVFNLHNAPIAHAASTPRLGAHLGSHIPGQGDSIVRRLVSC